MNNLRIYPYKMGSESASELATSLNAGRVYPDGNYSPKTGHVIINWGSSVSPAWADVARRRGVIFLNTPSAVARATNKLKTFEYLRQNGVTVPEFTTDMALANHWLDDGFTVIERHSLSGNSGVGIRVVNDTDDNVESTLTSAPLYTKYIPKKKEFRVNVFRGEVIDYAQKKKRGTENRGPEFNKYICSSEMGWVFCKNDIDHIDAVKVAAVAAVRALGLDFAAVDIMFHRNTAYVLEVNTAPGMSPSTLEKYVLKFRPFITTTVTTLARQTAAIAERVSGVQSRTIAPPPSVRSDNVTFTIDRATALKLKSVLAQLV